MSTNGRGRWTARCANCGEEFLQHNIAHVYCSALCRHAADELPPGERVADARRRVDDEGRWHPGPPEFWELDRGDSDELRERWCRRLTGGPPLPPA